MDVRSDWVILTAVALLTVFGQIVQTYALGSAPSFMPLALGGMAFVVATFVAAGGRAGRLLHGRGGWIAWGVAVALMTALLVLGRRYRGGLYLPGRINPSEAVKFCMVVFTASRLSLNSGKDGRLFASGREFLGFAGALGLVAVEVALAGDLGLLAQLALTVAALLFVAAWGWGVMAMTVIVGVFWLVAGTSLSEIGHLAVRFAVWRDPLADATGAGWQTLHGLAAVVNGGVMGLGRDYAEIASVPIVASDFVYAGIAETWGLLGCVGVMVLWMAVLLRGLAASWRRESAGEHGEALLAAGVVASLGVQLLLNVAGVLNAFPMTGITLPLLSHGGSSLAVTLLMCGVLQALSGNPAKPTPPVRRAKRRTRARTTV